MRCAEVVGLWAICGLWGLGFIWDLFQLAIGHSLSGVKNILFSFSREPFDGPVFAFSSEPKSLEFPVVQNE